MSKKCKTCGGSGRVGDHLQHGFECGVCHGSGMEPEPHTSYQHAVSTQPMHGLRTPPQSGWSCPRCTRIYGPTVQICVPCNTKVAQKENA